MAVQNHTYKAKQCNTTKAGARVGGELYQRIGVLGQKRAVSPRFIEQVLDCLLVERSRIEAQAIARIHSGHTGELKRY